MVQESVDQLAHTLGKLNQFLTELYVPTDEPNPFLKKRGKIIVLSCLSTPTASPLIPQDHQSFFPFSAQ